MEKLYVSHSVGGDISNNFNCFQLCSVFFFFVFFLFCFLICFFLNLNSTFLSRVSDVNLDKCHKRTIFLHIYFCTVYFKSTLNVSANESLFSRELNSLTVCTVNSLEKKRLSLAKTLRFDCEINCAKIFG